MFCEAGLTTAPTKQAGWRFCSILGGAAGTETQRSSISASVPQAVTEGQDSLHELGEVPECQTADGEVLCHTGELPFHKDRQ